MVSSTSPLYLSRKELTLKREMHSDDIEEIDSDDYYRKNSEFRLWLLESKEKYFDELNKEKQRKYFEKFVERWNSGSLKNKFYEGIRSSQIPRHDSTRHQWGFSKKLNESELESIRDSVDSATYSNKGTNPSHNESSSRRVLGPKLPSTGFELAVDQEEARKRERFDDKRETKAYRKRKEEVLEELVPKETGREAMLAKRREKSAHTKRERSPDVTLNDNELLGHDDFKAAVAREKAREAKRNDRRHNFMQEKAAELNERAAQYRAKEEATLEMFRKMAAARKHPPPPSQLP